MKKSAILLMLLLLSIVFGVSPLKAASWPGPDGFGYNGQTATISWVDITGTGTNLNLTDDSNSAALNLGFTFPFYGSNYTQIYAGSNGIITFGSGSSTLSNQCPLPSSTSPNDLIAVVWDDLLPSGTNNVYFQAFATCPVGPSVQCAIVEYGNVPYYSGGGSVTAEAILYPNGVIRLQFQTVGQNGSSSTTGIENNNAILDYGLTYACNTSSTVSNNTAILFSTAEVCGDGVLEGAEACDDSNTTPGDGCSGTCTIESGWNCTGVPSVCTAICGDGVLEGAEACDDSNTTPGDGCSGTCTVEGGWNCIGEPSVCTTADADGDGVGDAVENAAPNGGDGNNDGIQDSVQSNVASLTSATGQGYVTVVATGCGQLTNVYTTTEAAQPQQDNEYDYPFGLVGYTLPDCAIATVRIIFHGTADLAGFISKKFDPSNLWYGFGTIATNTLTVNLTDNAQGDSNPAVGTITDPVGPALRQGGIPIPTLTEWGMIIFMVLAGLGAVYYMRRQRRAES